jgi:predicted porin
MQKKIIALAVAGLVSGAAFAQSNVTIYGVADVGVVKNKGQSLAASANGNMNGGLANNGNSRLGFKGSEDLGGGLKANFTFEQTVNLADGSTAAAPFSRQAWAGVSGGFGEVQIGQNYSAGFKANAVYDMTGMANYSASGKRFGYAGGSRNAGQVIYLSPNMGGMQIMFGHVLKGTAVALDTTATKAQNEVGLTYVNGPIAAGLAWADNGNGKKDKSVGGSFNFGMGRAVAAYFDPAGDKKGYVLGVADVKAGPVLLTLEHAKDTGTAGKPKTTLIEAKFPLSKRTFIYANYNDNSEANADFYGAGIRHNF